jgi:hypothetical protein
MAIILRGILQPIAQRKARDAPKLAMKLSFVEVWRVQPESQS